MRFFHDTLSMGFFDGVLRLSSSIALVPSPKRPANHLSYSPCLKLSFSFLRIRIGSMIELAYELCYVSNSESSTFLR